MASLSLNPDPDFNINVAFNTMNKRLGELVNSGKMSLDQARAAQAEMRALQLNPAAANRQAATDIFQRHLQVGKYHPENVAAAQRAAERAAQQPQGGLTQAQTAQGVGGMGQSVNPVTPPQRMPEEIVVTGQRMPQPPVMSQPPVMPPPPTRTYYDPEGPVMPPPPMPQPPEREVIGYMTPPPGVRNVETRIFADQPVTPPPMPERHSEYGIPLWRRLPPGPERDAAYAQYMKAQGGEMQPKGIGGMLQPDSGYGSQQPMVSDMAYRGPYKKPRMLSPNELSIGRGPVPLDQQGAALGGGIGAILGSLKAASQGVGGMPMQPKGLTLSNVPQQGVAPQPMSAPQGMAMGGLLRKYYGGGMC